MKRKVTLVLVLCSIGFGLTNQLYAEESINNGRIDLSKVDWSNNSLIQLKGDWDFYWNRFLLPVSSNDSLDDNQKLTATLPGSWTKIELADGTKCSAKGFGTYRVRIKLKNESRVYALKVHSIFTAYKLWINEDLVSELGEIGKTDHLSKPRFLTREIPVTVIKKGDSETQVIDVVFQVSNFFHRRAGIQQPIYFGTLEQVLSETKNTFILNLLLIGIILIIGLNHLLMFVLRRTDITNLMFGILSVIMILRNLSTGERILLHWFPNMSWELLVRLDNFSGFATISLFALFFYRPFRKEFPKTIFYVMMGIGAIITVLVFSTSAWFYGQFRMVFELYILFGGLYLTFGVLLRAAFRKKRDAVMTFIGMFILYATAINDVLSSMGIIKTAYVAPYGIAIFMLIESFLLTRKSAVALKENETLSHELADEKQKLEDRIEERTSELSKQTSELEKYQHTQEKQNWINESLNQISEVMRQNKDNLATLADQLLATVIRRVNGLMGAIFLHDKQNDEEILRLVAHFGLSQGDLEAHIDLREGLVGHCFSTGKSSYMSELPAGYFHIASGLGHASPQVLALIPMIVDEKVIGVIEIASFHSFDDEQQELLEKASISIAAQLNLVKMNDETRLLLDKYRTYESELKQKEEEFRLAQEELELLREKVIMNRN